MNNTQNFIVKAYRRPQDTVQLSESQWDLLIRQARSSNMLARLCVRLEDQQVIDDIPYQARFHLTSAKVAAEALHRSIRWEVHCICQALAATDIPVVLLKGAAYSLAELAAGVGRQFEDVDILVPKEELNTVERKLMLHGWVTTHRDAYDQRYYRQWMHELPPMRHVKRQSSLDVHHTILPETARLHPDPKKLFAKAVLINDKKPLYILSNPDIVLHSATHLFSDGELNNGFRDLTDLDLLLRDFSRVDGFWDSLLERAKQLDLSRPLFYALRYVSRILGTPIPVDVIKQSASAKPNGILMVLMDFLFAEGLQPDHSSCRGIYNGMARWMLYLRSHYLRMPLHLLLPHLIRKAFRKDSKQ